MGISPPKVHAKFGTPGIKGVPAVVTNVNDVLLGPYADGHCM